MDHGSNFEYAVPEVTSALVYTNTPLWESQYIPAIELILRLDERGVHVTHLVCSGVLNSCPANPFHELAKCNTCKGITIQSKKKLIPAHVKVEELASTDQYSAPYFDSQIDFRQFKYGSLPAGQLAYSQMVDDSSDLSIPLSTINQRGRNLISEAVNLYEQSLKIIIRDSIQAVFVWNGRRSSDGPVLYAARQLGLKAYSFSSGSTPDRFHFQENSLHSIEEWSKSISNYESRYVDGLKQMEIEAEIFFSNQRLGNRVTYDYNYFGKNFKQKYSFEIESSKKRLVIFTSSQWETVNYFENAKLHPDLQDAYQILGRILTEKFIVENYSIVVRWHPNLQTAGKFENELVDAIIAMSPLVEHIRPDSEVDSYSLLLSADVVLTTGSTMGVEANYYGKASILLGTALYMNLNVCHKPYNFNELLKLLSENVTVHSREGAILYGSFFAKYGYKFMNFSFTNGSYNWKGEPVSNLLNPSRRAKRLIRFILHLFNLRDARGLNFRNRAT